MAVHWKRSVDGFVESHDGRWRITPNYFSCVAAQSYRLVHDGKTVSHACQTQRDAKEQAMKRVIDGQVWKLCASCKRDNERHKPVARFFPFWRCRGCDAWCCEHLCGLKDGDKASCGNCQRATKVKPVSK